MATLAAPEKICAVPAISAALFEQHRLYIRQTRFSWSPRLYFYDEHGKTLAFVRNATFTWNRDIRIFTDPTLSFELLRIRPRHSPGSPHFEVVDCVNNQCAGAIRFLPAGRLQCRQWSLLDSIGQEVGTVREDSLLLAGMRRILTELVPQSYSFHVAGTVIGNARSSNGLLSPDVMIDVSSDCEKRLDRRLLAAAMVLLVTPSNRQPVAP